MTKDRELTFAERNPIMKGLWCLSDNQIYDAVKKIHELRNNVGYGSNFKFSAEKKINTLLDSLVYHAYWVWSERFNVKLEPDVNNLDLKVWGEYLGSDGNQIWEFHVYNTKFEFNLAYVDSKSSIMERSRDIKKIRLEPFVINIPVSQIIKKNLLGYEDIKALIDFEMPNNEYNISTKVEIWNEDKKIGESIGVFK